jgi:hypothetical protein
LLVLCSARLGLLPLRRNLIVGCEHRPAAIGELRRVLLQAGDNAAVQKRETKSDQRRTCSRSFENRRISDRSRNSLKVLRLINGSDAARTCLSFPSLRWRWGRATWLP